MSSPQQLRQQTSNCSSLLIYRPRKDERLSWPSWLTYSGWLTHISGHPSGTSRAQDSEIKHIRPKTNALPLDHATSPEVLAGCVVLLTGCLPLLVHLIHDVDERSLSVADHERATRARASAALHNVVVAAAACRDDASTRHEARVLRLLEQLRSYCDHLRPAGSDVPLFVPGE